MLPELAIEGQNYTSETLGSSGHVRHPFDRVDPGFLANLECELLDVVVVVRITIEQRQPLRDSPEVKLTDELHRKQSVSDVLVDSLLRGVGVSAKPRAGVELVGKRTAEHVGRAVKGVREPHRRLIVDLLVTAFDPIEKADRRVQLGG
ncbi:hypothetical protein [Yimella lutea]|uniref:hypothetical protein n=1 Tax=Yimella lutea TaxID=587872 RepID=UPI001FEB59EF|nr:hypothetical protein [Yimella lutea]